jgi:hypothetical protein
MSSAKEKIAQYEWLADRLKALDEIEDVHAELARLQANKQQIHDNILRTAKVEAGAESEALLTEARTKAKALVDDARQQAHEIVHCAKGEAATTIAEAEDRIRHMDDAAILTKAQELVRKAAADGQPHVRHRV